MSAGDGHGPEVMARVETLTPGDRVFVHPVHGGYRPVLELLHYEAHAPAGPRIVVVYRPITPAQTWENRATAARGVTFTARTEATLAAVPPGTRLRARREL